MVSDAEWSKRLTGVNRRARNVARVYDETMILIFPPVPYFSAGGNMYFIVTEDSLDTVDAAGRMAKARIDGAVPTESAYGHWVTPHYAMLRGGGAVKASDLENFGTDLLRAKPPGSARAPIVLSALAACEEEGMGDGDSTPPRSPRPPSDERVFIFRPYPATRGLYVVPIKTHTDEDPRELPDWQYTQPYVHVLPLEPKQFDVSAMELSIVLEAAERLDYRFAQRMQGLQNATLDAVWPNSDRHGSARDATNVTESFLRGYMSKFINRWGAGDGMEGSVLPIEVIREIIHMHQEFAEEWDSAHKRTIAPTLLAGAEAFIGMFSSHPAMSSAPNLPEKWALLSRFFIRHPTHSAIFSVCLQSYMVKMEQDRGARNANYKSMTNAGTTFLATMNTMSKHLTQHTASVARELKELLGNPHYCLHPYFVDWHWIASELPIGHNRFRGYKLDVMNPYRTDERDTTMWEERVGGGVGRGDDDDDDDDEDRGTRRRSRPTEKRGQRGTRSGKQPPSKGKQARGSGSSEEEDSDEGGSDEEEEEVSDGSNSS